MLVLTQPSPPTSLLLPIIMVVVLTSLLSLAPRTEGFKYHEFCAAPPMYLKTRFPLYRLEVDTKTNGIPWAYRQNNTLTVSVKALYEKYKIKQLFISVPTVTRSSPEVPAKRLHLGEWTWDMKGGVIPLDCSKTSGGFGGAANAVRNLWWYQGGFYNVSAEWDPVNTIYNAYNTDMVEFEAYVSPDAETPRSSPGTFGPMPEPARWVKLTSDKFVNLDYIDLHRWIRSIYGPIVPDFFGQKATPVET